MSPARLLILLLHGYGLLVVVWSFGSWVPQWRYAEWYRALDRVVAPYVNLFRGLRLQIGAVDLSAMAALAVLWLLESLVAAAAGGGFPR